MSGGHHLAQTDIAHGGIAHADIAHTGIQYMRVQIHVQVQHTWVIAMYRRSMYTFSPGSQYGTKDIRSAMNEVDSCSRDLGRNQLIIGGGGRFDFFFLCQIIFTQEAESAFCFQLYTA